MHNSHRSCARRCRVMWRHMALGHSPARHNPSLWRRRYRLELIIAQSEARTFTTNSPPQTRSVSRDGCDSRSGDCVAGPDDAGAFEAAKRSGPQRGLMSSRGPGFATLPSIRNGRRCSARPWKAHLKDTYPYLLQPQKKKCGAVEWVGSQQGPLNQASLPYKRLSRPVRRVADVVWQHSFGQA